MGSCKQLTEARLICKPNLLPLYAKAGFEEVRCVGRQM